MQEERIEKGRRGILWRKISVHKRFFIAAGISLLLNFGLTIILWVTNTVPKALRLTAYKYQMIYAIAIVIINCGVCL